MALKVYNRDVKHEEEFQIYNQIQRIGSPSHPGFRHVRSALDTFTLPSPCTSAPGIAAAEHHCLVQNPMWDSWKDLLRRNSSERFTEELLKAGLHQLLLALDFLHTDCKIVHTDIKSDNVLQEIADQGILNAFTQAELTAPSARKEVDGHPVYRSRRFELPRQFGDAVLGDFGSAVRGDQKRNEDAQPEVYRSPETMLKVEWSYPVDIWNVGCMIWDLFEGRHLFYGQDPDGKGYSTRAHLAEVMALLGPPPLDLIRRGARSSEFFSEDGKSTSLLVANPGCSG